MYEEAADSLHGLGEVLGGHGIQCLDDISGSFGLVDIRPGSTVDDALDVIILDHLLDSLQGGDVELLIAFTDVGEDILVFLALFGGELYLVAQLAVSARN